jgi:hypothetical protein
MPPAVDLTLAINYLPAVACIFKTILLASILSIPALSDTLITYPILAMLLNIDRLLAPQRIFDTNAVLCSVLLSCVVNTLRLHASAPPMAVSATALAYVAFSLLLVVEPNGVPEFFALYSAGAGRFRQALPAIGNCLYIASFTLLPAQPQSGLHRILRASGFAVLCIAWVYVVSLWRRPRPRGTMLCPRADGGLCVFACHALLARFSPVLYIHYVAAVVFAIVCVAAMGYHYAMHGHLQAGSGGRGVSASDSLPVVTQQVSHPRAVMAATAPAAGGSDREMALMALTAVPLNRIAEEDSMSCHSAGTNAADDDDDDDEDLEALLRTAKEQQALMRSH